ncbi:MAG: DUF3105 domain-containing protein [bacterium]|nr:DUF3105 domain-containing protein [bacterium]
MKKLSILLVAAFVLSACGPETATDNSTVITETDSKTETWESYEIQGQDHVTLTEKHDAYNSNPPTSGWHTGESVPWGVYEEELPDEKLIHNLEHGGIWISYADIDEDSLAQLEEYAKKHSGSVVVTPRSQNDSNLAVAAWGKLLKMDDLDMALIEEFYAQHKNKSPEKFAGE